MQCPTRLIECKENCTGPVEIRLDKVTCVETSGDFPIIETFGKAVVSSVCGLELNSIEFQPRDWVDDEADVLGVAPYARVDYPLRIVTITRQEGIN